jgi:hypothetical protein
MSLLAYASEITERLNLTENRVGITSVLLYLASYLIVMVDNEWNHNPLPFDILRKVSCAEWDTQIFYGVVMSVGKLGSSA